MTEYQDEQLAALKTVRRFLDALSDGDREALMNQIGEYLRYRREVEEFLKFYFSERCNRKCFQSRLSACCSRDGIITFWADMLINALVSTAEELAELEVVLQTGHEGFKCVYLYEKKKYFTVIPEDWMVKIEEPCFMLDVTSFNMHTGVIGWAMRFHIEDRKQK